MNYNVNYKLGKYDVSMQAHCNKHATIMGC